MSNCDERDYPAGSNPECIPVPLQPREIGKPLTGLWSIVVIWVSLLKWDNGQA
jgi:hypothetical protein